MDEQKTTSSPFASLKIDVNDDNNKIDLSKAGQDQSQTNTDQVYAHGLPDWDLLPINTVVRRNNNE